MNFSKPKHVVGVDIGSHSIKAVKVSRSARGLSVDEVGYAVVDRTQINADPVMAQADALREALRNISLNNSMVVGALPGQTVVIRYPRLRGVTHDNLADAVEKEASQNIPYDLSEVLLDWTVLDEHSDGEDDQTKVLLVAAKHEVIDGRVQVAMEADVQYSALSVDSLALADAAEGCDFLRTGETTALINIGAQAVSIHFMKDGISNFIRDVSWGAKELIQAISKAKRCDYEDAEALLYKANAEIERTATHDTESSETEIIADSPPPMPGGSALDPMEDELGTLGNEVPILDDSPTAVEQETTLAEILSAPIARLTTEIRRSFDYYEHQLYERPVDRVILSGGVAHLTPIQSALREDMGIEDLSVADFNAGPIRTSKKISAAEFDEHPAQFMVAVGLAARGAVEL